MQAVNVRGELGAVGGLGGRPVSEGGLGCLAVSQAVGDGEAGVSFQLGKYHQHLPAGVDRERKRQVRGKFQDLVNTNLAFLMLHCVYCTKVTEQGQKRGCKKQS